MKKIVYCVAIVVMLAVAYEFIPIQLTRGSISYSLIVDLVFDGEKPNRIDFCVVPKRSDAEIVSELDVANYRCWDGIETIKDFDGRQFIARVRGDGSWSPLGRTVSRWQEDYLVIIAHWSDGQRISKIVSIPDGRISKQITVSIP